MWNSLVGCKKKSNPEPPEAVNLVFPNRDSECTTGTDLNPDTSEVEFQWTASNNTESYELRVTNINTDITQTITHVKLFLQKFPLPKVNLFLGWYVRRNTKVNTIDGCK